MGVQGCATVQVHKCLGVQVQGRPQDLAGRGPRIFFFRFGNLHVASRHALC